MRATGAHPSINVSVDASQNLTLCFPLQNRRRRFFEMPVSPVNFAFVADNFNGFPMHDEAFFLCSKGKSPLGVARIV